MEKHRRAALLLAALVLAPGAAQALTVSVAYDLGHAQSTGAFTAAEQAVFTEAAGQWSAAIGGTHAVTVTFVLANLGGATGNLGFAVDFVADGGVDGGSGRALGNPTSATVFINDAITFFVDGSPAANGEYSPSAQAGAPASFLDSGPAAFDLLTVALHEIAHGIGFDSDYQGFWSGGTTSTHPASNGRPVYAFQAPAASGDPAYDAGILNGLANGGVYLIPSANEHEDFVNNGKTTHADDQGGAALGAGYFPFDLMNPALNQQERRLISGMDVDVLCDAYAAYSCAAPVPEPREAPLVALALLGLALGLRRRG